MDEVCPFAILSAYSTTPVDEGGEWSIQFQNPRGTLSQSDLVGDKPCFDKELLPCGITRLIYRGEVVGCEDEDGNPCYVETVLPLFINCAMDDCEEITLTNVLCEIN